MILTSQELTAASSAVAALAIIGGYLGVRSANRNAVKIAREERAERRKDELNALKRSTYAGFLGSLTELSSASVEVGFKKNRDFYAPDDYSAALGRRAAATRAVVARLDEIRLISPAGVYGPAKDALDQAASFEYTAEMNDSAYIKAVEMLQARMQADLYDSGRAPAKTRSAPASRG